MAAENIDVTQGAVYGVVQNEALTPEVVVLQGAVYAAIKYPAEYINASQAAVRVVQKRDTVMRVSMARVYALGNKREDNRVVRAWPFKLDGHDFYVIRLGDDSSLVCDLTTGQWAQWASPDLDFWRLQCGMNWLGMPADALADGHTSNVLAGDDTAGILWTLKPEQGYDEATRETVLSRPFTRRVVGGIPMRLRETQAVGGAYLTASIGEPTVTGAEVTLRTSDDNGKTWADHGTITANLDEYDQEFSWRSLGLIRAPGRIFEITDNGASVRIDGLDIR